MTVAMMKRCDSYDTTVTRRPRMEEMEIAISLITFSNPYNVPSPRFSKVETSSSLTFFVSLLWILVEVTEAIPFLATPKYTITVVETLLI